MNPLFINQNKISLQTANLLDKINEKKNDDKMISEATKITAISLFSSSVATIAGISQGYPIDTIKTRL